MEDILAFTMPVFGLLAATVVVVFAMKMRLKRRELVHKERLAAIEKGIDIPQALLAEADTLSPNACLLRGLIWLVVGIALSIFFTAMAVADGDRELYAVATLGLIPAGVGIVYLVMYSKTKEERALTS